jgi:putative ABC transport system permease protein
MFKQIAAITAMSLKAIPQRPLSALVTIIGVATMVAVITALLALGAGLTSSGTRNIGPDQAVVLAKGAASDYMGSLSRETVGIVAEAPGVKKDAQGRAFVSPATALVVQVSRQGDHRPADVALVGVLPESFGRIDGSRLTKGRLFRPGLRELVAGRVASRQFEHLQVGDHISLRGSQWTVVGEYESNGSTSENALLGDADTVLSAFGRNAYQNIAVRLNSPADFNRFKESLVNDPRLSVDVKVYRDYIQGQLRQLTTILNFVGYFVGTIMAVGAFFGILNTMYSAVDARRREIATLRAVGFSRFAILVSVTLESLVLALPGAILGAIIAWVLFDGHLGKIDTLAFPIAVTPGLMAVGIVWTLVIGLIGGLAPSIFAARLPIATALRAT